jgi:hypothetical protein
MAGAGGLGAKDLVWTSSMKDWQPAETVEGLFASAHSPQAPAADPSNPYAAPQSAWQEPATETGGSLQEIPPGSDPIDVGACVKRAFELTKRNFGTIFLIGLTYIIISIIATVAFAGIDSALGFGNTYSQSHSGNGFPSTTYSQSGGPVSAIVGNVFSVFLSLGVMRIGLNLASGKQVSVGMLFGEGRKLFTAIVATILFGIMIVAGFILLIVPGFYLMLRYGQYMGAIVDKDKGILESLSYSSSITTNNRLNLFLLILLSIAIFIAGFLALVVGLVFAYPVIWLSWMVAFRWMQYGHRAVQDHPGTTTPLLSGV